MIRVIDKRTDTIVEELFQLWNGSVRATHNFLSDEDIVKLYPFVREGLLHIEKLAVLAEDNRTLGFIGVQDHKIEMLFIDNTYLHQGYGKKLVSYSIKHWDVKEVSVNEANPQAKHFYEKLGFKVSARHELDEQGMPFPILDMKL